VRGETTALGSQAHWASPSEALTKQLEKPVLLSRAFAVLVKSDFDLNRVGEYPLPGFNDPVVPFAYQGS
jgi:adenylate cyclase